MRVPQKNVHCRRTEGHQPSSSQGTQAPQRLIFPKSARLRKRREFLAVKKTRRFFGNALAIDSTPSGCARLGITVPKKFGSAVARNQFKRRVREIFRHLRSEMPPLDIVVFPKRQASNFSFDLLHQDLVKFHAQFTAKERG